MNQSLNSSIKFIFSKTIDRSKFREQASRLIVFTAPLLVWGKSLYLPGLVVIALGLCIRSWAAGHLRKDQSLAQSGPYLFVRHPLYLGSCLLSLGMIILLQDWIVAFILALMTTLSYYHTIRHEEECLKKTFGSNYENFSKTRGLFIPKFVSFKNLVNSLKETSTPMSQKFSFAQFLKNKEYECLFGSLGVIFILFLSSLK